MCGVFSSTPSMSVMSKKGLVILGLCKNISSMFLIIIIVFSLPLLPSCKGVSSKPPMRKRLMILIRVGLRNLRVRRKVSKVSKVLCFFVRILIMISRLIVFLALLRCVGGVRSLALKGILSVHCY